MDRRPGELQSKRSKELVTMNAQHILYRHNLENISGSWCFSGCHMEEMEAENKNMNCCRKLNKHAHNFHRVITFLYFFNFFSTSALPSCIFIFHAASLLKTQTVNHLHQCFSTFSYKFFIVSAKLLFSVLPRFVICQTILSEKHLNCGSFSLSMCAQVRKALFSYRLWIHG